MPDVVSSFSFGSSSRSDLAELQDERAGHEQRSEDAAQQRRALLAERRPRGASADPAAAGAGLAGVGAGAPGASQPGGGVERGSWSMPTVWQHRGAPCRTGGRVPRDGG